MEVASDWKDRPMLVLTRRVGEQILIGDEIVLTVVRIQGDKVRLGIEAPKHIAVHRDELRQRLNAAAELSNPLVGPVGSKPTAPAG
jgi:carbon storage regulator